MGREYDDPALRDQPEPGGLEVSHHVRGIAVVRVRGEHDLSTAPRLTRALAEAAAHSSVLVDLSECSFIDSTVIGALLRTSKTVRAGGEHFALVIRPEQRSVTRMAEMTRLADILAVHPSREAALASLEQAVQQDARNEKA